MGAVIPLQLFIGAGTAVNVLTVAIGSLAGMLIGDRLTERARGTITDLLGLVTLVIGGLSLRPLTGEPLNRAVGAGAVLVVILVALLVGTLAGAGLRLEDRIEQLADWLRGHLARWVPSTHQRFVDGFVTATLVFCIGPMTILGALSDGLGRGADQLFVKAVLDGFSALAFASSFGVGVLFSALGVALVQGVFTLLGWALGDVLPAAQIDAISVAGGVILLGLGLRLLGLKRVRVAEMLPGLLFAPALVWLVETIIG